MARDTSIRVLIVSPAEAVVAELCAALNAIGSGAFSIDVVPSAGDAMVALRTLPSELTLVDVGDGKAGRMRELAQVSSTTADTALIAFTSVGDELTSVAALELGAQECLVRSSDDLTPGRLMRSLRNALVRSAHDGSRPLATMIELSSDAIMTINRERVLTRFNPAAEELFGWNASEVLGKPSQALVPDSDHREQVAFVDRVLHGDSVEAFEVERRMRDGRTVIMSMSGSPIADAFGNVIEACLIIRDVTDQVNARLRLVEQQHLLENSQAAGRIGSWAVDRLTGRIDWSAEHYRLLKRNPSLPPATLDELLELVHPDDHELVRSSFLGEARFTFEARFIADPEDVRILRVRGEYIPREDGQPGRLLGITQDVTEERAEQAARQLAEEQLRRAFDEALIGMAILDMDSRPLRVNNALCEILGRTRDRAAHDQVPGAQPPGRPRRRRAGDGDTAVRSTEAPRAREALHPRRRSHDLGRGRGLADHAFRRHPVAHGWPDPGHHPAPRACREPAAHGRSRSRSRACSTAAASTASLSATSPAPSATA